MAAENKTVNGNYGSSHAYGQAESYIPSQGSNVSTSTATIVAPAEDNVGAGSAKPAETTGVNKPPSKDEVGWYFVESYYTTLSKNPETLHVRYCYHTASKDISCGHIVADMFLALLQQKIPIRLWRGSRESRRFRRPEGVFAFLFAHISNC